MPSGVKKGTRRGHYEPNELKRGAGDLSLTARDKKELAKLYEASTLKDELARAALCEAVVTCRAALRDFRSRPCTALEMRMIPALVSRIMNALRQLGLDKLAEDESNNLDKDDGEEEESSEIEDDEEGL